MFFSHDKGYVNEHRYEALTYLFCSRCSHDRWKLRQYSDDATVFHALDVAAGLSVESVIIYTSGSNDDDIKLLGSFNHTKHLKKWRLCHIQLEPDQKVQS